MRARHRGGPRSHYRLALNWHRHFSKVWYYQKIRQRIPRSNASDRRWPRKPISPRQKVSRKPCWPSKGVLPERWTVADNTKGAAFSAALDEALSATQILRCEAERLSGQIDFERPEVVRATAIAFENQVDEARPVLDRFVQMLRDARHHTLESAYRELIGEPEHEAVAARMRDLIREYQETQAIIAMAGRRLNEALGRIDKSPWLSRQESVPQPRCSTEA